MKGNLSRQQRWLGTTLTQQLNLCHQERGSLTVLLTRRSVGGTVSPRGFLLNKCLLESNQETDKPTWEEVSKTAGLGTKVDQLDAVQEP